ncbi:MAG: hypothetical protein KGL95_04050 [Patescibacteria group bacterium]|nr:hypothetical protein [Patescibacteria group bacterium]
MRRSSPLERNNKKRSLTHYMLYKFPTVNLKDICNDIKPFDLILSRGPNIASRVIREAEEITRGCSLFSHVGMFINYEAFPDARLQKDNSWYILESLLHGDPEVLNIDKSCSGGVQIRPLYDQLISDTEHVMTYVHAPLRAQIRDQIDLTAASTVIKKFLNKPYDDNPVDISDALEPKSCVCLKTLFGQKNSDKSFFCSELACRIFQEFHIITKYIRPDSVLPVDFLPGVDFGFPPIVNERLLKQIEF